MLAPIYQTAVLTIDASTPTLSVEAVDGNIESVTVKDLYSAVTAPTRDKASSNSLWLSDEQLLSVLNKFLGDKVYIHDPALSSVINLFVPEQSDEAAHDIAKTIAGHYAQDGDYVPGYVDTEAGVPLSKPVVIPLNTHSIRARSETDTSATGGVHWVTCIILPKNYQPSDALLADGALVSSDAPLGNEQEIVFFIDSLNHYHLPASLLDKLRGGSTIDQVDGSVGCVPAAFPHLSVADYPSNYVREQPNSYHCGDWVLFNILMVLATGKNEFLQRFHDRRSRAFLECAGANLRSLFASMLDLPASHEIPRAAVVFSSSEKPMGARSLIAEYNNLALPLSAPILSNPGRTDIKRRAPTPGIELTAAHYFKPIGSGSSEEASPLAFSSHASSSSGLDTTPPATLPPCAVD